MLCKNSQQCGFSSLRQGFSYAESINRAESASQFPYWLYIPDFFDELEGVLETELQSPNLHDLVLYQLWDRFRLDQDYTWTDLRIRAESGGVSLSARSSGSIVEIDVRGINHLARTLRRSVNRELRSQGLTMPSEEKMDEVILRTLIREFGAKSYELSLERGQEDLFKAHIYFGMKPDSPGPDSFPHLNCFTSWRNPVEQLQFLLQFI